MDSTASYQTSDVAEPRPLQEKCDKTPQEILAFLKEYKENYDQFLEAQGQVAAASVTSYFCLIEKDWLRRFEGYVNFGNLPENLNYCDEATETEFLKSLPGPESHPGPIDNSKLLKDFNKYIRQEISQDASIVESMVNYVTKGKIQEKRDFEIVSEKCWDLLHDFFGGGPVIKRGKAAKFSFFGPKYQLKLEKIKVWILPPLENFDTMTLDQTIEVKPIYFTFQETGDDLKTRICTYLQSKNPQLQEEDMRLWKPAMNYLRMDKFVNYLKSKGITQAGSIDFMAQKLIAAKKRVIDEDIFLEQNSGIEFPGVQMNFHLNQTMQSLQNSRMSFNRIEPLIVEISTSKEALENKKVDSKFLFKFDACPPVFGGCDKCMKQGLIRAPCPCGETIYCSSKCRKADIESHLNFCAFLNKINLDEVNFEERDADALDGLKGIKNLGNTCFMNSAIQCLSNLEIFRNYFLKGYFKTQINQKNVLGSGGEVAVRFAQALDQLWNKGNGSVYNPSVFKASLGRANEMFQGNGQHDSAEFLGFLLDTLHEDLNQVQNKEYQQLDDKVGTDAEIAEYRWDAHLKRNQSLIVDLVQGQFKSTIACPKCKKEKKMFDPYMTVQLPIPQLLTLQFFFVSHNPRDHIFEGSVRLKSAFADEPLMEVKSKIAVQASEFLNRNVHPYSFVFGLVLKEKYQLKCLFNDVDISTSDLYVNDPDIMLTAYEIPPAAINQQTLKSWTDPTYVPEEETKDEEVEAFKDELIGKIVLPPRDLHEIVNSSWLKVPVQVQQKKRKEKNLQSFSYFATPESPIEFVDLLPRLLWVNIDWPLAQVHKYVSQQFLYFCGDESLTYEKLFLGENGELPQEQALSSESTDLPFTISIENPFYSKELGAFSDNSDVLCRICSRNDCSGCPLCPNFDLTLRELLAHCTHRTDFAKNDSLLEIPSQHETGDENNFYFDTPNTQEDDQDSAHEDSGARKTFILQLLFIQENFANSDVFQITNELQQIESHPRRLHLISKPPPKVKQDLQTCLRMFRQKENLSKEDAYFCQKCQKHVQASKKLELYSIAPVVVFTLNRFKQKNAYLKEKLEDLVNFPLQGLNMSPFVLSSQQHALMAPQHLSVPSEIERRVSLAQMNSLNRKNSITKLFIQAKKEEIQRRLSRPHILEKKNSLMNGKFDSQSNKSDNTEEKKSDKQPHSENQQSDTNEKNSGSDSIALRFSNRFDLMSNSCVTKPDDNLIYDLFAVTNHHGNMNFGHYTAFAKNSVTGKWHYYNDSIVEEVEDPEETVVSPDAYILYYKLRSLDSDCRMTEQQLMNEAQSPTFNFGKFKSDPTAYLIKRYGTGQEKEQESCFKSNFTLKMFETPTTQSNPQLVAVPKEKSTFGSYSMQVQSNSEDVSNDEMIAKALAESENFNNDAEIEFAISLSKLEKRNSDVKSRGETSQKPTDGPEE